jgi:hypothetical protein
MNGAGETTPTPQRVGCCLPASESASDVARDLNPACPTYTLGQAWPAGVGGSEKWPFWRDCGGDFAGSNHFRHFPAQWVGRFAFGLFLAAVARVRSSRLRANLPAW